MHIVSAFEYTTELELALLELEKRGIHKNQIVAIPLDKRQGQLRIFDNIHRSDGVSVTDSGFALGMILMVFGFIYGYVLAWGPIFVGLLGLITGFLIGTFTKYFYLKRRGLKKKELMADIFLTIKCDENQQETIEKILWDHNALAIGVVSKANESIAFGD